MPDTTDLRNVLVLRPWLSTVSGGDYYAHFDGLVMQRTEGRPSGRYGDYDVLCQGDDGRKTLHLDHFRFQCQVDDRHTESYAWKWGYQPSAGTVFALQDLERFGPSITAIGRGLDRCYREDGPADGVGRYVVRLARVLKLDGVALLETSHTGSFRSDMEIRRTVAPGEYGDAIRLIDALVVELHHACVRRSGRIAA